SRPAERVVCFLQQARDVRAMDQGGQRRDQVDATVVPNVRRQRGAAPASCARLQPRQFPAHAGDAGADQGLVPHDLERQADQDRREGSEPRPLCRLPDGRGRHRTANVPRDIAAHRGTAAAATTSASVRRSMSCIQEQLTEGVRPNARENGQINPSATVRAARCAGSRPQLASGFQGARKSLLFTPLRETSGECRFRREQLQGASTHMKSKYVQLACMLVLAAGALAIRSVPLLATSAEYASLSARNLYAVNQSSKNRGSISIYDIDAGHRLIKTIHTVPDVGDVRGVAVSAVTGKLYVAYRNNAGVGMIYCVNVNNETVLWNKAIHPGVDRLAINPNGQLLYVP